MRKSIGYQTRLYGRNSVKVTGGIFGGALDLETVNRLVSAHFTVTVKPSGSLVFVDREGREVSLYLSVDPGMTDAGQIALKAQMRAHAASRREEERKRARIDELLDGMTTEEALRRLGGE